MHLEAMGRRPYPEPPRHAAGSKRQAFKHVIAQICWTVRLGAHGCPSLI